MSNPENEKLIEYLVVMNKPGRRFSIKDDSRWGGLLEPGTMENPDKTGEGLRVALFASWDFGYLVLETLKEFEKDQPGRLNLVGLVTDNPLNPDAKISLKKRVWNLLEMPYRVIDETYIIESGLSHGIPVYTGEIKVPSFQSLLKQWNPDAILVCVFGQVIDSFIINLAPFGIYNFHPSDLSNHQGAGPAPYDDLVKYDLKTTVWSVHQVSEEIDGGAVMGNSPAINVRNEKGELPADPLKVYRKLAEALSPLTYFLIDELVKKHEQGKPERISSIDFSSLLPEAIAKKLMNPVTGNQPADALCLPKDLLFKPR
jgi:hypothetical protein